jgi:WD40 repeat protein
VLTGTIVETLLWEVVGGKLIATLSGHKGFVTAVGFSPDGKLALTASDGGTAKKKPSRKLSLAPLNSA